LEQLTIEIIKDFEYFSKLYIIFFIVIKSFNFNFSGMSSSHT